MISNLYKPNTPDELCQMQVKFVAKAENIRHDARKREGREGEMLREREGGAQYTCRAALPPPVNEYSMD